MKRALLTSFAAVLASAALTAQGRGGRGPAGPPPAGKAAAPFDMTGTWVSLIVDEWRFRVSPQKGDLPYLPLNAAARQIAQAWDPAKDEAEGNQCKAYGAAALMRIPGRLHITWQDDNTLRIDTDAGLQTRLFHFGATVPKNVEATWQGYSVAQWEYAAQEGGPRAPRMGDLKVVTTALKPGYLRKNGVPYSANTVVTEYYDLHPAPNGDTWLVITTEVNDPQYLTQPFITSTHFKKQADASGWTPEPCSAR